MKKIIFLFILLISFSCDDITVTSYKGKTSNGNNYIGNGIVKKISIPQIQDFSYFEVLIYDFRGNKIEIRTSQLTYNVNDTIHIDATQKICYPINDPTNISKNF
jgi:hypothetical protein